MRHYFEKYNIAYGNHCRNLNAIYAAIAFNPSDIFLYAKPDYDDIYPDNFHAVTVSKLNNLIKNIKEIEKTIGDGVKCKVTKGIRGQK